MHVDCADNLGKTALCAAAFHNRTDVIRLLLQNGANANKRDGFFGHTPLHCAASENSTEAIAVLVKHGASINYRNRLAEKPIDLARRRNKEEAVRMLEQL